MSELYFEGEPTQHARLGLSNGRWPFCPGSVREEATYQDEPGDAAIDGTGSHLLLEMCIESGHNAGFFLGATIGVNHPDREVGWLVDQERADRVQMCLDYISRREGYVTAESRSSPGQFFGRDDWWGTTDVVILGDGCLEIIDYKDGRGYVSAEDNTQLIGNAAGHLGKFISPWLPDWDSLTIKTVRLTIVQPKTHPPVRSVEMTPRELWENAGELAIAAHRTDAPDAPCIPDDKNGKGYCRWCKHRDNCDALTAKRAEATQVLDTGEGVTLFDQLQSGMITLDTVTGEQLAELLDAVPALVSLCDSIEAEGEKRETAEAGSVPGYFMKSGRKSYTWAEDEETIAKKLSGMRIKKDDIYPRKLASPAQIKKLEGMTERRLKRLEELTETKYSKSKLEKKPC